MTMTVVVNHKIVKTNLLIPFKFIYETPIGLEPSKRYVCVGVSRVFKILYFRGRKQHNLSTKNRRFEVPIFIIKKNDHYSVRKIILDILKPFSQIKRPQILL